VTKAERVVNKSLMSFFLKKVLFCAVVLKATGHLVVG
jgi:hypothetical protein